LAPVSLKGVFTDIDDTLTLDGVLVPEAYAAICRLHAAGLRVIPVTGRPAGWAAVIAATWPVDAVVAENGAVWFRRSGPTVYFDANAQNAARLATIRDDVLCLPRTKLAADQWLRLTDVAFDIGETQKLSPAEIAAIVDRIHAGGARSTVSSVHAHAFFGDHDKARALVRVAHELWSEDLDGPARTDYVYVGDSPNDAAGFAHFPNSVGVANLKPYLPSLLKPPPRLMDRPGGLGFADLAAELLR
jgi:HAD superfamily hydrolase (TIGR01484 family)